MKDPVDTLHDLAPAAAVAQIGRDQFGSGKDGTERRVSALVIEPAHGSPDAISLFEQVLSEPGGKIARNAGDEAEIALLHQ